MILHLDTHVVVWIGSGELGRLSETARNALSTAVVQVSPIVSVELAILAEIGRISRPDVLLDLVLNGLGATLAPTPLTDVGRAAERLIWTRDPFDRLIAGAAVAAGARLVTRDRVIRANLGTALW